MRIDYPNDPYCHPSFTTMTGNNDANKPAQERMYNPAKPNMERLTKLAAMLGGRGPRGGRDAPDHGGRRLPGALHLSGLHRLHGCGWL